MRVADVLKEKIFRVFDAQRQTSLKSRKPLEMCHTGLYDDVMMSVSMMSVNDSVLTPGDTLFSCRQSYLTGA